MPSANTIERFVKLVAEGRFIEAMEEFYEDDATATENCAAPRVGLPALIAHERATLAAFAQVEARTPTAPVISGDRVVIHWHFTFRDATGKGITLEELSYQTWRGEKLVAEQFFYDSRQLRQ